jgi:endo-1,4-beta-xylanase
VKPHVARRIGALIALSALALTLVAVPSAVRTADAAALPVVSIGDASIAEGTSTARNVSFAVTLSTPATATVTVRYQIVAGTASAADVDTVKSRVRTLTFGVGATGTTPVVKTVNVKVLPDSVDESDETFRVVLSNPTNAVLGRAEGTGTILDDDPIANGFRVSVSDESIVEGHQGSRKLTFTVSLSQAAVATVSLDYTLQALSATAGSDFVPVTAPKRLTFTKGPKGFTPVTKTLTVPIVPDAGAEGDETFAVVLSNPIGGIILADPTGIGRVIDDEPARRPLAGAAVRWPTLGQQSGYAAIAGRRFDLITPENEMKWDAIEPQRGQFNFVQADAIVNFAVAHGEAVHGHALAWYSQNPAWLTSGTFTRDELIEILTTHIASVVGHYTGRVSMWDVVNEPIGDDGQTRSTIWSNGIGADYVDIAFRAARAADPAAKLYVNEYGIEGPGAKSDALYALVAGLVARGVPIDGVGFQTHITPGSITVAGLQSQFARYAALGLDVAITELDVRVAVPPTAAALAAQAATYAVARDACTGAPNCESFTTWGFTDAYSWIPAFVPGQGAALPWDAALQPKPAYSAIASLLRN